MNSTPSLSEEIPLFTPGTSGGLLTAVSRGKLDEFLDLFAETGYFCWMVGEEVEGEGI